MPTRPYAIVHYHEIGLKGRNRSLFENILVRNLATALTGTGAAKPRKLPGRVLIALEPGADRELVAERLMRVFGVANFGLGVGGRLDPDALGEVAWSVVRERGFRDVRRARQEGALGIRPLVSRDQRKGRRLSARAERQARQPV